MTLSASEFYEAGLNLPPSVRKDVALRLLESVEVVDDESIAQAWTAEISGRVEEMVSGAVQTVPGEQVFADIAARRAARDAAGGHLWSKAEDRTRATAANLMLGTTDLADSRPKLSVNQR